jgi:hypothetical protein
MPYSYIEENKLLQQESVFPKKIISGGSSQDKNNSSQASINASASVSVSQDEEEGKAEKQDKVEDFLFTSPFTKTAYFHKRKK